MRRVHPSLLVLTALLLPAALLAAAQDVAGTENDQEEFMHTSTALPAMEDLQAPGDTITIKLDLGTKRDRAAVRDLASRLKALPLLASTSIAVVGRDKLVLTPSAKHDLAKVKQLLLEQPEIYELEVNEEAFRRPGARPYEQVRKQHLAESMASSRSSLQQKIKDKLRALLGSRKKGSGDAGGEDGSKVKRRRKVKKSKGGKAGSGGAGGQELSPEKEAQRAARRAEKKAKRDAKRRELKREGGDAEEEERGDAAGGEHVGMGRPDVYEDAGYVAGQGNPEL